MGKDDGSTGRLGFWEVDVSLGSARWGMVDHTLKLSCSFLVQVCLEAGKCTKQTGSKGDAIIEACCTSSMCMGGGGVSPLTLKSFKKLPCKSAFNSPQSTREDPQ